MPVVLAYRVQVIVQHDQYAIPNDFAIELNSQTFLLFLLLGFPLLFFFNYGDILVNLLQLSIANG